MTESFSNLFSKYTLKVSGDGNCFIHSAMLICPNTYSSVKVFRELLYQAAVDHFGQDYVKANPDYSNIKKDNSWVEWAAGAAALSLLMNEPVVVVSPFGSIKAEKGNVEVIDPQERNKFILKSMSTIVYDNNHFQPLKNEPADRESFVEGLNEIDNQIQNATSVDYKNLSAKQAVEFSDKQKDNIQVLYDAINNAFSSDDNRIKAKEFVKEILAQTPEDERDNMAVILLGGIIAQSEHKQVIQDKTDSEKTSVLAKAKVAKEVVEKEAAEKMKTGVLPKNEKLVFNTPQPIKA